MRVTSVRIKNVLGISEASLECGSITEIRGKNGSSKSSLLAAIQAGLQGGDLARLQKVGTEEEPEVVLVLDGGRFRVEREGGKTDVLERVGDTAAYEKVRRPQSWLDSLFDPILTNPLRFLSAHPNDRADLLLEVLPLQLDREAFMAKIATAWPAGRVLIEGHPLEVLGFAREVLFDERTGVNRSQKDKASSAYELQKALPAEMPEDPADEQRKVAQARDELFQDLAQKKADAEAAESKAKAAASAVYEETAARINGDFKTAAAKLRGAAGARIEELKAELERAIAAVKETAEAAVNEERRKGELELAAADQALGKAEEEAAELRKQAFAIVEALRPELQALDERAGKLAAQSQEVARLQKTKEMADRFAREAESFTAVADELTKAITAVDMHKRELVQGLPIEGLEIQGKQILVNGIPFDQLNTAKRIQIAVKVATLRARTQVLPVVFVDGAEALDADQYAVLISELEKAGVQAFVAKVEDGDLAIAAREGKVPEASAAKVVAIPPAKKRRSVLVE